MYNINFCCIAKWLSYTYIYSFSCSFPFWFITRHWILVPVLYNRTLSFIQLRGFFFLDGVGIVALQCWVSFCHTMQWISFMYTYIPFPLGPPSYPPSDPTLLGLHRAPSWTSCAIQQLPTSYLFPHGSVHTSTPVFLHPTLLLPLCPHILSLHLHLYSCPVNRFICAIFQDSTYIR